MAVAVSKGVDRARGRYYAITLGAANDAAQARLAPVRGESLSWATGDVGWQVTASVAVSVTNGDPERAFTPLANGNGNVDEWFAHPDSGDRAAGELAPITGLRFKATAAAQRVVLWTRYDLADDPAAVAGV